jgi:hypothetical protein
MSHNESKFGKKKSGNKFSREKKYASSEEDILLAQHKSDLYNETRSQERHHRRTLAGLEDVTKDNVHQKEDVTKNNIHQKEHVDEPVNKYDIKKFGSTEEAEKYLYNCHTCNRKIKKNSEFCCDKCKEYILVYNYPCIWGDGCKMCKLSKRVKKDDDDHYDDVV